MNKSFFLELIAQYMPKLNKIVEKVNGKKNGTLTYLHEKMLRTEYSADQKWESASVNTTYVAADIVDMDSPLPLKKRDSMAHSNGDLPTMGMKMWIGNKQLNAINVMIATGRAPEQIVAKILNDSVRCVNGMKERLELCFLQGLSEGVTAVEDISSGGDNVGTGIRLNFGYLPENSYGAEVKWGETGFKPISDLRRVLTNATGASFVMLAKETYDLMRRSDEARELAANAAGAIVMEGVKLAVPLPTAFNAAILDELGVTFILVDRNVVVEANGKRKTVRPWNANKVIFLTSEEVGALVYGTLPEEMKPVDGVTYTKPMVYALLSKYSKNDPYAEFTQIQGIVAPIIENVEEIWSLDISEAQEVSATEVEDDANITIYGQTLVKADVIAALKTILGGRAVPSNSTDTALIEKVNKLNDEQEAALKEALGIEPDSDH
jgi:hypothetical protein